MSLKTSFTERDFSSYLSKGDDVIKYSQFNIPRSRFLQYDSKKEEIRYGSSYDCEQHKTILLSDVQSVERSEEQFAFAIITEKRKHLFYAKNHELREKWVDGLYEKLQNCTHDTPKFIRNTFLSKSVSRPVLSNHNRILSSPNIDNSSILREIKDIINSRVLDGSMEISEISSNAMLPSAIRQIIAQTDAGAKLAHLRKKLCQIETQRENLAEQVYLQYGQITELQDELDAEREKNAGLQAQLASESDTRQTEASNPDLDILKVGFEGTVAIDKGDFIRSKVYSDGTKIIWNKFGLFTTAEKSILIEDIVDIQDDAIFKPYGYHHYITIQTKNNQQVAISIDKSHKHYLRAIQRFSNGINHEVIDPSTWKKSLNHTNARMQLLMRMIRRYKSSLLDSIWVTDNNFSNQQALYKAELHALMEMATQSKKEAVEQHELLERLEAMNEIVVQANKEKMQLLHENARLKGKVE